ncbi:MAG: 23S rRNA methyltransferase [Candidatus Ozemobacter sibiricus]|jgi:23S rRNA (uridine2552-2'-O)-methyltransferase|uniref:Ribosomal RNA large subunit methyltransferase E n=1 Tax=Candidatus Ozemobacter sibiricus TaxID=2268124 RepID=A0A367ZQU2_9BACT|nr:MAG: 23S rRNA methyltransferase [Candidatus Ozemobacter sibiricus]
MPDRHWIRRRLHDPFLKKAHREDFRSRAAYKLQEIAEKYKLIQSHSKVLDLGCAPGSWCQVVRRCLGPKGLVIGVDLLPVEPIDGVTLLQGDLTDPAVQDRITSLCPGGFDVILSDMAPHTTGIHHADTERSAELVGLVLDLCARWLKPGGAMLAKVFEGAEYPALRQRARTLFRFAKTVTPEASLARSREVYLLGQGYHGPTSRATASQAHPQPGSPRPASPGAAPPEAEPAAGTRANPDGRLSSRSATGPDDGPPPPPAPPRPSPIAPLRMGKRKKA